MHSSSRPRPDTPRRRPDVRGRALSITALATVALGAAIAWWPQEFTLPRLPEVRFGQVFQASRPAPEVRDAELRTRFEQGVAMLHMRQHEYAMMAFHRVLALAPDMPEAHANMGFALIGLEQWETARSFFETAIELRRDQLNAYYGLAIALEAQGDLAGAMGAMQVYLHRAPDDDPFRARADAAMWEWREAAGRSAGGAAPAGAPEKDAPSATTAPDAGAPR